jgi:hypothetical protein
MPSLLERAAVDGDFFLSALVRRLAEPLPLRVRTDSNLPHY